MVYLIYNVDFLNVVDIVPSLEGVVIGEEFGVIESSDFSINDLEKYDIRINKDGSIQSNIKNIAERKAIQLEKENIQQGIELSEREIQEIIQGRQISDLEIQLLELQLGGM